LQSQIFDQLPAVRTLVLVLETGSLTEAARKLGLSPSGVSKQIGRLEEHLGVRLLERTTRSIRATLAGLELCQRTKPLFESFEDAGRAVSEHTDRVAGRIRLSAAPAFGRTVLMPILLELGRANPELRFEVTLTGRRLDFVEDDIDLAIREGELEDSSLVARLLRTARVGFYASPAYLKARAAPRSLTDLARHDIVALPARGVRLDPEARALGLTPRFQVDDLFAVAELAEAGAGIAPLPDYVAEPRVANGTLLHVLVRTELARFPIHAVYPSRRHLPRRLELVIAQLFQPP
jgi:DNA-binding transcriptional LysR family regulator